MEIEPGCGKWASRIKWAFFKEYFDEVSWTKKVVYYFFKIKSSFNMGGSKNTGSSFSTSRLNFHIPAFKKRDTFSVWLFKKFMFRWKRFTFLPSLRQGILKKNLFHIIPRTRARKFSGLIFHIQDVENEPPVIKEIPPLISEAQMISENEKDGRKIFA